MLAYMNEEALRLTKETGIAHYYSRSRQALWKKGRLLDISRKLRVSTMIVMGMLSWQVNQIGAACHTGNYSCFLMKKRV